ncbi:MAG: NfeD family protein [Rhizobiaceae bacterium]|jgi:membrane protein implicated in regulation of membrane protease activity|nr:MAG: NfeD family protein [Rhizobiaceae bacterium]
MVEHIFTELGPWNWMVLGFVLLILEILVPGVFLLWIGIAAVLVGALTLQLSHVGFWVWQAQVLLFLLLSIISAYIGRQIMARAGGRSDQPLLNRRAEQLIGRTATLAEPIAEGRGRIRIGDTFWLVSGPDLPVGTRVRVTAVKDMELVVEPD